MPSLVPAGARFHIVDVPDVRDHAIAWIKARCGAMVGAHEAHTSTIGIETPDWALDRPRCKRCK